MKKIYEMPNMKVVIIEQRLLDMTSSLGKDSSTTISDNDDVLSRRNNSTIWDDDEE